jgi:hypothetical protein
MQTIATTGVYPDRTRQFHHFLKKLCATRVSQAKTAHYLSLPQSIFKDPVETGKTLIHLYR